MASLNDKPWKPKHEYECANGHITAAEFPIAVCSAMQDGNPCTGVLSILRSNGKGGRNDTGDGGTIDSKAKSGAARQGVRRVGAGRKHARRAGQASRKGSGGPSRASDTAGTRAK